MARSVGDLDLRDETLRYEDLRGPIEADTPSPAAITVRRI
jgi:hypothetical protein